MADDPVRAILADVTGDPGAAELPAATPLFADGLGLTSIAAAEVLTRIRDRLGVDVAALDLNLECLETVGTLSDFVAAARAGAPGAP